MRRAALGLAALLLAGCASSMPGGREVRTRYYTIVTDVAPAASPGVTEVAAFLDLGVELLSARLGRPPPPPASLRALLFATREGFVEHHPWYEAPSAGYYDPLREEMAVPLAAQGWYGTGPADRSVASYLARLNDAEMLLHEQVHQLMDLHGELMSCPTWLAEGLAELHAKRVALSGDLRLPGAELLPRLARFRLLEGQLALAIRALYGRPAFDGTLREVGWAPENYAAHGAAAAFLTDEHPELLAALVRGEAPCATPALEASLARWARLEALRTLPEQWGDAAGARLLELLWDRPGLDDLRGVVADEQARRAARRPPARPPSLLDRVARHRPPWPEVRAIVEAGVQDVAGNLDPRSFPLDELEAAARAAGR